MDMLNAIGTHMQSSMHTVSLHVNSRAEDSTDLCQSKMVRASAEPWIASKAHHKIAMRSNHVCVYS